MPAQRMDGNQLARLIRTEIAGETRDWIAAGGAQPGLAAVLIGDNPASQVYVTNKRKACEEVGFASWLHHHPSSISQQGLLDLIAQLNADPAVHGILVQLPLPRHIDEGAVIEAVHPSKDVDAFHPQNVGALTTGHPRFLPCTPHGVMQILRRHPVSTAGKHVVVLGRSNIVGKPLALMLMQKPTEANPIGGDATVTVCHTRTRNLAAITRQADILIAALGVPRFVTADMVQPGAVVIDVGINRVDGKLCGDVDFGPVSQVASAITPVPGGVGPMTIAMLLHNTLVAARARQSR